MYSYADPFPKARYDKFVELAGCSKPAVNSSTFDCLVAADSEVLQNASGTVSTTLGYFGSFAFLPVIDGDYIQERPAAQLLRAKLNGKRVLIGVSLPTPCDISGLHSHGNRTMQMMEFPYSIPTSRRGLNMTASSPRRSPCSRQRM